MTPEKNHFVSDRLSDGMVINGQTIEWVKAKIVYFYDGDGNEYTNYRQGVVKGKKIDSAKVPVSSKSGYSMKGWLIENTSTLWDFDVDTVDADVRLTALWELEAPTVTLAADRKSPHVDKANVLTASASHGFDSAVFTYQWYKDGVIQNGKTESTLTVKDSGTYTVKVTASDTKRVSEIVESNSVTVTDHTYVAAVTSATCTEKGYTTHTCSICQESYIDNYVEPISHSFGEWTITKPATETEKGQKQRTCSVCGTIETAEIPALGHSHNYGTAWKTDASNHWHECVCGEKTDIAAHTFKWVVDKEATATEKGSVHEECKVCGYKKAAVATPPTSDKPKTGDNSELISWFILLIAAGAIMAGIGLYSGKCKSN